MNELCFYMLIILAVCAYTMVGLFVSGLISDDDVPDGIAVLFWPLVVAGVPLLCLLDISYKAGQFIRNKINRR